MSLCLTLSHFSESFRYLFLSKPHSLMESLSLSESLSLLELLFFSLFQNLSLSLSLCIYLCLRGLSLYSLLLSHALFSFLSHYIHSLSESIHLSFFHCQCYSLNFYLSLFLSLSLNWFYIKAQRRHSHLLF